MTTVARTCAWHDEAVWQRSGFSAFLSEHGIARSDLIAHEGNDDTSGAARHEELRFFRIKSTADGATKATDAQVIERVAASLKRQDAESSVAPERVPWIPGFFSLPATTRLANVDMYQQAELYGIDISSGYAVTQLNVQPGDHVLDLCCAPGAKLTMISDLLQMQGSVTGVDFSRPRIGACKQLVHKYQLVHRNADNSTKSMDHKWRCRLFHADGRTFSIGPLAKWDTPLDGAAAMEVVLDSDEIASRDVKNQSRKRKNKSARARDAKQRKLLDAAAVGVAEATIETESTGGLYDKVLVDAECTHDGSIKHLQKLDTEHKWTTYVSQHLNASETQRIITLQGALIANGFALLRKGGDMIYSTCSLSLKQNEEIVEAFLKKTPHAELIPIDTTGIPCEPGRLAGTVRFTPAHHTSGLFIAKIHKAPN